MPGASISSLGGMNPPDTESGKPNLLHAERRLAARSRELDALQAIGRVAAEAPSVDGLCDAVIAALHTAEELDVVLDAILRSVSHREASPSNVHHTLTISTPSPK